MAFTAAEKVDVRRFCGYPTHAPYGTTAAADYGNLETRMDRMDSDEIAVVRTKYLAATILPALEAAVLAAGDNLDTERAAVWTRNKNEVADRLALFNTKRRELCAFIGCRPGPGIPIPGQIVRT